MNKVTKTIMTISNSIIIAGMMLLLYGLYYLITKGGVLLPFHDAPEEVLKLYKVNVTIANTIIKLGFVTLLVGAAYQVIKSLAVKNMQLKEYTKIDIIIVLLLGLSVAAVLIALRGAAFLMFGELDEMAQAAMYYIGYSYPLTQWTSLILYGIIVSAASAIITSILIIWNKNKSNSVAYILLGIVWSGACFMTRVWIWEWGTSDLFIKEPIIVFLSNPIWIIWLAVPCIVAVILLIKKKKKDDNKQDTSESIQFDDKVH